MQLTETVAHTPADSNDLTRRVTEIYADFGPRRLHSLRDIYAEDVCFEDPVHAIQGLRALTAYFETVFQNVDSCRFKFHRSVVNAEEMFLSWTMMLEHNTIKRGEIIRVEGASYLKCRGGKIYYHRDYFDLGAMVYENLPVLGGVCRFIRHQMAG